MDSPPLPLPTWRPHYLRARRLTLLAGVLALVALWEWSEGQNQETWHQRAESPEPSASNHTNTSS